MDTTPTFLSVSNANLELDLSSMGPSTVSIELAKLEKPEVQRYQETLTKIENLHEGVAYKAGYADDDVDMACAECQMPWPCATYKLIHPPKNNMEEAPF
jgi:hypothetical protein